MRCASRIPRTNESGQRIPKKESFSANPLPWLHRLYCDAEALVVEIDHIEQRRGRARFGVISHRVIGSGDAEGASPVPLSWHAGDKTGPHGATETIQATPKRSAPLPKRGEQYVLANGICTWPPAAS